jgi:hypothetical protein
MDAKKMLVGVATTALGFAIGLYLGKMLINGGSTPSIPSASTPSESNQGEESEFGYSGFDY